MRASGVLLFGSVSLCCRCLGCAPGLLRRARALPLPLLLPLSVLPLVLFAPFGCPLPRARPSNERRRWFGSFEGVRVGAGAGVSTPSSRSAEGARASTPTPSSRSAEVARKTGGGDGQPAFL